MKYPLSATADGYALRRSQAAVSAAVVETWRLALRHWGLLAALAIAFAIHLPTLRYYFDGDDFVVLGSAEYLGGRAYIIDTFLMRDIVPNWRPLTGAIYAVEWELFGLNAAAWRSVNLAVHLASMVVLYALVLRVTRKPMAAALAAAIFGVSGAHFDTVTYITALPHVLATFFVLSSLLALVSYAQDGERSIRAYWLSFALFTLAFLANEGSFVFAPVMVLAYALFAVRWRRSPQRLVFHAAPFVLLAAGWTIFYQTADPQQVKFEDYYWGGHVFSNYAVYLSWLAFPAQSIPLDPNAMRWALAALVAAGLLAGAIAGPNIVRIGALGVGLALLPFVPVSIWTASRYTYAAVAFFAPVAAVAAYAVYERAGGMHGRARVPAAVVGLALVATVVGLYSWQSYAQDASSGRRAERWQVLAEELERNYGDVPDGTTIYIIDGLWQNPMEQYTWVPSVARALYGDAVAFNLPRSSYEQEPPSLDDALFLQWTGSELVPVEAVTVLGLDTKPGPGPGLPQ